MAPTGLGTDPVDVTRKCDAVDAAVLSLCCAARVGTCWFGLWLVEQGTEATRERSEIEMYSRTPPRAPPPRLPRRGGRCETALVVHLCCAACGGEIRSGVGHHATPLQPRAQLT